MTDDVSRFGLGSKAAARSSPLGRTQEPLEAEELPPQRFETDDDGGDSGDLGPVAMNPTSSGADRFNLYQSTKGEASPGGSGDVKPDNSTSPTTPKDPTGGSSGGPNLTMAREGGASPEGGGAGASVAFGAGAAPDAVAEVHPDLAFGAGATSPGEATVPLTFSGEGVDPAVPTVASSEAASGTEASWFVEHDGGEPDSEVDPSWRDGLADPVDVAVDEPDDFEPLE